MLIGSRYLGARSDAVDLATGMRVRLERIAACARPFTWRAGRVLIDVLDEGPRSTAVWERSSHRLRRQESRAALGDIAEALSLARPGVPVVLETAVRGPVQAWRRVRECARLARLDGWVPMALPQLLRLTNTSWPGWLASRSLVLLEIGNDPTARTCALTLAARHARSCVLLRVRAGRCEPLSPAWHLREAAPRDPDYPPTARQSVQPQATAAHDARHGVEGDVLGVLQLCQEAEDDHAALGRVGSYLRERLNAAGVAYVVREGSTLRVLAGAGLDPPQLLTARQSIEAGCPVSSRAETGSAEAALPVRHAAEVIGALLCRWAAGSPDASPDAERLLGVAAAASAPSLRAVVDRHRLSASSAQPVPELVGESDAMQTVRALVLRAAGSPFPVVIEGESGSGKEVVAKAIHAHGTRSTRRFCALNCAALVDELVEAELFGHARGAFTGAMSERTGLFEDASGGTLFLDEVAELSARVQAKLLRTLQEGEVRRLGETVVRRVDVRVVAATNKPLAREVTAGRFRQDLWYRLDVLRIALPPLRERLDDLPALVEHLWASLARRAGSRARLSHAAVTALGSYDWPGNVRELQNVLASIMVAAPRHGVLGRGALPPHLARVAALAPAATLHVARRHFEERFIRAALARAGGRTAVAARELGLTRQGLAKALTRLGIEPPPELSALTASDGTTIPSVAAVNEGRL